MMDKYFLPNRMVFLGGPDGPKPREVASADAEQNETVNQDVEKALKEYSEMRQRAIDTADSFLKSENPTVSLALKETASEFKKRIAEDTVDPSILSVKRQNTEQIKSWIKALQDLVVDMSFRIENPEAANKLAAESFTAMLDAQEGLTPEHKEAALLAKSMAKNIEESIGKTGQLDTIYLQAQAQALSSYIADHQNVLDSHKAWSTELEIGGEPCRITYGETGISIEYKYSSEDGKEVTASVVFDKDGKFKSTDEPFVNAVAANVPRLPRQPEAPAAPRSKAPTAVAAETPPEVQDEGKVRGTEERIRVKNSVEKDRVRAIFESKFDKPEPYQDYRIDLNGKTYMVNFGEGTNGTRRYAIDQVVLIAQPDVFAAEAPSSKKE